MMVPLDVSITGSIHTWIDTIFLLTIHFMWRKVLYPASSTGQELLLRVRLKRNISEGYPDTFVKMGNRWFHSVNSAPQSNVQRGHGIFWCRISLNKYTYVSIMLSQLPMIGYYLTVIHLITLLFLWLISSRVFLKTTFYNLEESYTNCVKALPWVPPYLSNVYIKDFTFCLSLRLTLSF